MKNSDFHDDIIFYLFLNQTWLLYNMIKIVVLLAEMKKNLYILSMKWNHFSKWKSCFYFWIKKILPFDDQFALLKPISWLTNKQHLYEIKWFALLYNMINIVVLLAEMKKIYIFYQWNKIIFQDENHVFLSE